MTQPTLTLPSIVPGQAGWDSVVNLMMSILHTWLIERPLPVKVYTISTLPSAADYQHCIAIVSDGASNKKLVFSDGSNWRYAEGTAV